MGLLVNLESTLSSAQASEARGDADAAVAKTAAIKNIQKALTARILKRLDDGQPLVEVARKMKAIEGMQPQINDMERRLGIMQSVEPVLETPSRPSRRSSMSAAWARSEHSRDSLLSPRNSRSRHLPVSSEWNPYSGTPRNRQLCPVK